MEYIVGLVGIIAGILIGWGTSPFVPWFKPKRAPMKPRKKPGPKPKSGGGPGEGGEGP